MKLTHEDVTRYIDEHPDSKRLFDFAATRSVATFRENHPGDSELGRRLKKIETRIQEKETLLNKNELKFYAFKACADNGVDYDLLDGFDLKSETEISDKIGQLSESITTAIKNDNVSKMILEAHRPGGPGAGIEDRPKTLNQYLAETTARLDKIE